MAPAAPQRMQPRLDPASHDGYQRVVPPAPSDRLLLLVTGSFVVLAALVVAAVLFFATGGANGTPKPGPVYVGLASDLRDRVVKDHQPNLLANPFGDAGIWIDLESNRLVALIGSRPGMPSCVVDYKNLDRAFIDCHGQHLSSRQLDRYRLLLPLTGAEKGGAIVDFRHVEPAPEPIPARG
jgi:hypothetical protein